MCIRDSPCVAGSAGAVVVHTTPHVVVIWHPHTKTCYNQPLGQAYAKFQVDVIEDPFRQHKRYRQRWFGWSLISLFDFVSMLYRFRVITSYLPKVADFNLLDLHLASQLDMTPFQFRICRVTKNGLFWELITLLQYGKTVWYFKFSEFYQVCTKLACQWI